MYYTVTCTKSITIVLDIEADSQEQAEELANEQADFENYGGWDYDYSVEQISKELYLTNLEN